MKKEKIQEIINLYRLKFQIMGMVGKDFPHDQYVLFYGQKLTHCHGMLAKMELFLNENRIDKAYRWLGFIQGVLWSEKIYTLEELKNHNKPDKELSPKDKFIEDLMEFANSFSRSALEYDKWVKENGIKVNTWGFKDDSVSD